MTIRSFLDANRFVVDHTCAATIDGFSLYVRYYDFLALALYFDHLTGKMYAVRFESIEELAAHQNGETPINDGLRDSGFWSPAIRLRERISVMPTANVDRIQTERDLRQTFTAFNRMVDCELNGIDKHGFEFGERVTISFDRDPSVIGTITNFTKHHAVVRVESGHHFPFTYDRLNKLPSPFAHTIDAALASLVALK